MVFPGDEDFPDQEAVSPLRNKFKIEDGDVVMIGSAFSYEEGEKGA